jgi:hypothetical protein
MMWETITEGLSEYLNYVKIALACILLCIVFYSGYHIANSRYLAYRDKVELATKEQDEHVESIKKQQELVTKGIQDEYNAKLANIRNYYESTSMWNNTNRSSLSGISPAPKSADVIASYNQLATSCAATTQQLVSLQEWIRDQMSIK